MFGGYSAVAVVNAIFCYAAPGPLDRHARSSRVMETTIVAYTNYSLTEARERRLVMIIHEGAMAGVADWSTSPAREQHATVVGHCLPIKPQSRRDNGSR